MDTKQSPDTPPPNYLFVCVGPSCGERGGKELVGRIKETVADRALQQEAHVVPCFCFGQCPTGPNACSTRHPELLTGISPEEAEETLDELTG